jgi:hypothetical protein
MSVEYIHPSVSAKIIDTDVIFITAQGLTVLFAPHFSKRGEDRTVKQYTSPSEYLFYCAEPDISKYRQAPNNIVKWLQSGGLVKGLRLTANDATFGHIIFNLQTKYDSSLNTVDLIPSMKTVNNVIDYSVLSSALFSNLNSTTGFKQHPLWALVPKGRGVDYNRFGVRFSLATRYTNTYDFVVYTMEIIERVNNSELARETFDVSFEPDARSVNRDSMFIVDVLSRYSKYYKCIFSSTVYDALTADLGGINTGQLNMINDNIWGTSNPLAGNAVQYLATDPAYHNFSDITYLQGGSDGFIGMTNSQKETAMDQLMIQGLSGTIDPSIRDLKMLELDVVLDGNESLPVKNAIANFASSIRGDVIACIDTGFTGSYTQALTFRDNFGVSSENVSIWAQDFLVFDEFTGRDIRVTLPYFLATKIPTNDAQHGIYKNFVGPRRGQISGFNRDGGISWIPNEPQKSELYMRQLNYVEVDTQTTYIGTQSTSKVDLTPLSNVSVARTAFRMLRMARKISDNTRFEWFSDETYRTLQRNLQENLNVFVLNGACEYVNVRVHATDYEKAQKLLRITITVKYTDIIERIAIGFVVSRQSRG